MFRAWLGGPPGESLKLLPKLFQGKHSGPVSVHFSLLFSPQLSDAMHFYLIFGPKLQDPMRVYELFGPTLVDPRHFYMFSGFKL